MMRDPQIRAREMIIDLPVPYISQKKIKTCGHYLKFSKVKPEVKPVPDLGEHTRPVLRDVLGYSEETINALARDGVFGPTPGDK
jgi:crotonobetainyl-CoA:carnitine CoA-transferase CaiB-like acyl-CoA transferase